MPLTQHPLPTKLYNAGCPAMPCRHKPWELGVPVDMAFPCATQHELTLADAKNLVGERGCSGCVYVRVVGVGCGGWGCLLRSGSVQQGLSCSCASSATVNSPSTCLSAGAQRLQVRL